MSKELLEKITENVQEEVVKVQEDIDKKLKVVENKMFQAMEEKLSQINNTSSTEFKKQVNEFKMENGSVKIKPPTYDGKQLAEAEKATALILALREALDILHSLSQSEYQSVINSNFIKLS